MTSNGPAPSDGAPVKKQIPKFQSTPLNQRILSTMDRRSVAAHPWHDLEIGEFTLCQLALNVHMIYLTGFAISVMGREIHQSA